MAQPSNYSHIPLNEHRPNPYPSTEVHPNEPDKSSTYHEEDDNKQPSYTLLKNQHFGKLEPSAFKLVPSMIPKGDPPPPYSNEHKCVVTNISPTYNSDPVNVNKPTSSTSTEPCLPENQTVTISATKGQRRYVAPRDKSDYLCFAICASVCCCFPLGLVAICMAIEANEARRRCDYDAVRRYNNKAYTWIKSAISFGIISFICAIFLRGFRYFL